MEPSVYSGRFRLIWFFRLPKGEITCRFTPQLASQTISPVSLIPTFLFLFRSHHILPMQVPLRCLVLPIPVQITM